MKELKMYDIEILHLKNGRHVYDFTFSDAFFDVYVNDTIQKGHGQFTVTLEKSERLIEASMTVSTEVELICDRTLEPFMYPLEYSERILFRYGETDEELTEELYQISRNKPKLNFGQFVYESILSKIPIKRLHPSIQDDTEDTQFWVFSSEEDDDSEEENKPSIDPRWEALKNLKK